MPAALRGHGWGARSSRAPKRLRARSCIGVSVDPYSFQARGFYEKQGYAVFAELDDCPPGGARYLLQKRIG